jgi:predicted DNA binding CopG/RHH family protein
MASEDNRLDGRLDMRVNSTELEIFMKKCDRVTGKPYQMFLREVITAFNDGRLRIKPTDEQKQIGELYS